MGVGTPLPFLDRCRQVGEDFAVLQALVDIGVFVVQVVDLFPQQPVVILLEHLAPPARPGWPWNPQEGECFTPDHGRPQGFPVHAVFYPVAQDLVGMGPVLGTGQYSEVCGVFFHHFDHHEGSGRVIEESTSSLALWALAACSRSSRLASP